MENTPIARELIDKTIENFHITDFAKATIREVKAIAAKAEADSGVEFIKMEMGVPGLPPSSVGVKAEMALPQVAEGVYLEFGGLLTSKGAKFNYGSLVNLKLNPYYLEIPVHMGYKYVINENFAVFGNAGPYAAIGVFGKIKAKADLSSAGGNIDWEEWGIDPSDLKGEGSENIFGKDKMKRFDLGLGIKTGVEFNQKYQVAISYDWGLLETIDDSDWKNRNLMISFSYMF